MYLSINGNKVILKKRRTPPFVRGQSTPSLLSHSKIYRLHSNVLWWSYDKDSCNFSTLLCNGVQIWKDVPRMCGHVKPFALTLARLISLVTYSKVSYSHWMAKQIHYCNIFMPSRRRIEFFQKNIRLLSVEFIETNVLAHKCHTIPRLS